MFNELFAGLGPNRDRALVAFWVSTDERRILQLAASLAAGTPVSLRDTVTGLYDHNIARLSPQSGTQQDKPP